MYLNTKFKFPSLAYSAKCNEFVTPKKTYSFHTRNSSIVPFIITSVPFILFQNQNASSWPQKISLLRFSNWNILNLINFRRRVPEACARDRVSSMMYNFSTCLVGYSPDLSHSLPIISSLFIIRNAWWGI